MLEPPTHYPHGSFRYQKSPGLIGLREMSMYKRAFAWFCPKIGATECPFECGAGGPMAIWAMPKWTEIFLCWGLKIGAKIWKITWRVTTKNLKMGQRGNFDLWPFLSFFAHFHLFLGWFGTPTHQYKVPHTQLWARNSEQLKSRWINSIYNVDKKFLSTNVKNPKVAQWVIR